MMARHTRPARHQAETRIKIKLHNQGADARGSSRQKRTIYPTWSDPRKAGLLSSTPGSTGPYSSRSNFGIAHIRRLYTDVLYDG